MSRAGSNSGGSGGSRSSGSSGGFRSRGSSSGGSQSSSSKSYSYGKDSIDITALLYFAEKNPIFANALCTFYYALCTILDRYSSSTYVGFRRTLSYITLGYSISILVGIIARELITFLCKDKDKVEVFNKWYGRAVLLSFFILMFVIDWPSI